MKKIKKFTVFIVSCLTLISCRFVDSHLDKSSLNSPMVQACPRWGNTFCSLKLTSQQALPVDITLFYQLYGSSGNKSHSKYAAVSYVTIHHSENKVLGSNVRITFENNGSLQAQCWRADCEVILNKELQVYHQYYTNAPYTIKHYLSVEIDGKFLEDPIRHEQKFQLMFGRGVVSASIPPFVRTKSGVGIAIKSNVERRYSSHPPLVYNGSRYTYKGNENQYAEVKEIIGTKGYDQLGQSYAPDSLLVLVSEFSITVDNRSEEPVTASLFAVSDGNASAVVDRMRLQFGETKSCAAKTSCDSTNSIALLMDLYTADFRGIHHYLLRLSNGEKVSIGMVHLK